MQFKFIDIQLVAGSFLGWVGGFSGKIFAYKSTLFYLF
jgi:hypothetical protein